MGGNIGGTFKVKDATIHFVEAVHSSSYAADEKSPSQYAGAPLGFVIQIDNGPTLYHGGDTGVFSSMSVIGERFKPTFALLPVGGHFTMDPAGAAEAARLLGHPTVVPMHYGTFPLLTGSPEKLEAEVKKTKGRAKVKSLEIGKTTAL
jgi:L-ascorbate metabolism protein UlaG (beta-lactamase superfamily)